MEGYDKFKDQIYRKTGINLSCYKERQMKRRIESLIKRNNFNTYDAYYNALNSDKKLFDEFINYLTINVSEFYRNLEQWKALKDEIIPKILKNNKRIKVWSAACSTGEEPYSLVMALSNFLNLRDIEVIATDIDQEAINKAYVGVYSAKSIANVPQEFKIKYFSSIANSFKIKDEIKNCVKFKKHNLLTDSYPGNCDLIVCRNVMIYFTEEAKEVMYKKFNDALSANGILFVGSTEQIILPHRYNFKASRTFFYEKAL